MQSGNYLEWLTDRLEKKLHKVRNSVLAADGFANEQLLADDQYIDDNNNEPFFLADDEFLQGNEEQPNDQIEEEEDPLDQFYILKKYSRVFINHLNLFLQHVDHECDLSVEQVSQIAYGLGGMDNRQNKKFIEIPAAEKMSFIEILRTRDYFLTIFLDDDTNVIQLKCSLKQKAIIGLYSLYNHVKELDVPELSALNKFFSTYFNYIHYILNNEELFDNEEHSFKLSDYFTLDRTHWYNVFVYKESKRIIENYELNFRDHEELYTELEDMLGDSFFTQIEKFIFIDLLATLIGKEFHLVANFYSVLVTMALRNCTAAAYWIVSNNELIYDDEIFNYIFSSPNMRKSHAKIAFIASTFPQVTGEMKPLYSFREFLKRNEDKINYSLIDSCITGSATSKKITASLQWIFMQTAFSEILENNLNDSVELIERINYLSLEKAIAFSTVLSQERHPLLSNKMNNWNWIREHEQFREASKELIKNARVFGQASRAGFFSAGNKNISLPDEKLVDIVTLTRNPEYHTANEAEKIAYRHFGKPF